MELANNIPIYRISMISHIYVPKVLISFCFSILPCPIHSMLLIPITLILIATYCIRMFRGISLLLLLLPGGYHFSLFRGSLSKFIHRTRIYQSKCLYLMLSKAEFLMLTFSLITLFIIFYNFEHLADLKNPFPLT